MAKARTLITKTYAGREQYIGFSRAIPSIRIPIGAQIHENEGSTYPRYNGAKSNNNTAEPEAGNGLGYCDISFYVAHLGESMTAAARVEHKRSDTKI